MGTSFMAVGKDDCPIGSTCGGYQLGGSYKLGSNTASTITTSSGAPLPVINFELGLKEVKPKHTYELAFGFENNGITESGSFWRNPRTGYINFKAPMRLAVSWRQE